MRLTYKEQQQHDKQSMRDALRMFALAALCITFMFIAFAQALDTQAPAPACVVKQFYVEQTGDDGITRTDLVDMCD